MLRSSVLRASTSTPPLLSCTATRQASRALALRPTAALAGQHPQQKRHATAHAISNPTLANIEKRWEAMPPQEQANLWMALRDRMKTDWHELTLQEKRAAYWIAFGPHGPRALPPPGENWTVFSYTMIGLAAAGLVFYVGRLFARPAPKTMTKEYQEMTNEYLKSQRTEPITGISSEGYTGKGMVQSKPASKSNT